MDLRYQDFVSHARYPGDPLTFAFAGVIGQSLLLDLRPLIRGLDEVGFGGMLAEFFPGLALTNGTPEAAPIADEFDDFLALLLEHRAVPSERLIWLSHSVATAAMRDNHLWQDLGLPDRQLLSRLLRENFPRLAEQNIHDMKWKKFFYRQLCQRAGVPICKSPNCADCTDYRICFGGEEGEAIVDPLDFAWWTRTRR